MKKVLVFADFPSPYRVDIFRGLSKHYNLTVFFDKISDQNRSSDWFCQQTGLNSHFLFRPEGKKKFDYTLKHIHEYDLVLAYDYHIKNAIILELVCIFNCVPYFMNCDGAFIRNNIIKNLIKRYLVTHASGYFASGLYAKKYFEHFGANSKKIAKHNFSSLHDGDIMPKILEKNVKDNLKIELGLSSRKTVISVGQFIHRKGFDVLLAAWKDIDGFADLIIIGGGEEKENYERIISDNQLNNVRLIDFLPKEQVFKYYKASDLFVLPTREDVWGLVINEAMACGLPVITTDQCLGGVELIENGENGFIVKKDNVEALKNKIAICLNDNALTESMQRNNLQKIKEYTIENVVDSHCRFIDAFLRGAEDAKNFNSDDYI